MCKHGAVVRTKVLTRAVLVTGHGFAPNVLLLFRAPVQDPTCYLVALSA